MTERSINVTQRRLLVSALALTCGYAASATAQNADISHDAEHYVLEAQHGEKWAMEDADIQAKLAALEKKHGTAPSLTSSTSCGTILRWARSAFQKSKQCAGSRHRS